MKSILLLCIPLFLFFSNSGKSYSQDIELNNDNYLILFPEIKKINNLDSLIEKLENLNMYYSFGVDFSGNLNETYALHIRLKEIASQRKIYKLTQHQNPVLRVYAYNALRNRNFKERAYQKLITDHEVVSTFIGCVFGGESTVSELINTPAFSIPD